MINILMLFVIIIMSVLIIILSAYLFIVYSHTDESSFGDTIIPKFIVIIGIALTISQIFLLQLDISNSRGIGFGLDMNLFWYIIFGSQIVYILILAPIALFYYESDEEKSGCSRICESLCWEIGFLIVISALITGSYFALNQSFIPANKIQSISNLELIDSSLPYSNISLITNSSSIEITFSVSPIIYLIGIFLVISWFLLILFLGIGFLSLPFDLIIEYCAQPKRLNHKQYENQRNKLLSDINYLRGIGKEIRDEAISAAYNKKWIFGYFSRRKVNNKVQVFETTFVTIEKEYEILIKLADYNKRLEPLVYIIKLCLGSLFLILSFLWIIHIIISQQLIPSLNKIYIIDSIMNAIEKKQVSFLTIGIYSSLCFYLLVCSFEGNIMLGARFFCVNFYPMEPNKTFLNSFLVNTILMNILSFSLTHFLSIINSDYIRLTVTDAIFMQIYNLKVIKYFFFRNIFLYILLILIIIGLIFLFLKPKNSLNMEKLWEQMRRKEKKKEKYLGKIKKDDPEQPLIEMHKEKKKKSKHNKGEKGGKNHKRHVKNDEEQPEKKKSKHSKEKISKKKKKKVEED